jgi:hypothetical protein
MPADPAASFHGPDEWQDPGKMFCTKGAAPEVFNDHRRAPMCTSIEATVSAGSFH